jgi:hypothetical protein
MIDHFRKIFFVLIAAVSLVALSGCTSGRATNPADAQVIHLLGGNDLKGFYTFLKDDGVNRDPDGVFTMTNGMLRISGQHLGYLATKRNYGDYRLVAEFKWGNATWAPRQYEARESGILMNMIGKDQLWPTSIECELVEGGTGDVLVLNGAFLTANGVSLGPKTQQFDRPGRNPWKDELGYRGANEIENAYGDWNTVEVVNTRGRIEVTVNGHNTLTGTDAKPLKGKILLQSSGAEVFFKKLDLYPIH